MDCISPLQVAGGEVGLVVLLTILLTHPADSATSLTYLPATQLRVYSTLLPPPADDPLTVIWISRLQAARSASLLTYILFSASFWPPGPRTRNTMANPPAGGAAVTVQYPPGVSSNPAAASFQVLDGGTDFH